MWEAWRRWRRVTRPRAATPRPSRFIKWALRIQEQQLGPEHPGLAANLDVLARFYRVLGKNRKAESLHKRALAIWEKALGRGDLYVAVELESYAALLSEMIKTIRAVGGLL